LDKNDGDRALTGLQFLGNGVNRLVESLVHPALRVEPDIFYRTRVLIMFLLAINLLMVAACVVIIVGDMSQQARFAGSSICLGLVTGNFLLLYFIRSRGSFVLCSLLAALLASVIIISGIIFAGGIQQSPATQVLVVPPLMVYFFAGRRWGTCSVLLAIAVILLFYFMERMGVIFTTTSGVADVDTSRMLATFICVAAVSALALMFERNASKLKQERDIEHGRARALAETDILTGLANRRSFDVHLGQRMIGEPSQAGGFTLCYVDLDGFKPVNDKYGHAVGDEVLCAVAARLSQVVRGNDVVGRHGGDEFTLIFDALSDHNSMQHMMERILASIREPVETIAGAVSVGASIGLACYPQHGTSIEALKKAADKAMYAAKQGRNQWRLYAGTPAAPATSSADRERAP
jgi:diguanylate cyclase (GGDEF)-like protein